VVPDHRRTDEDAHRGGRPCRSRPDPGIERPDPADPRRLDHDGLPSEGEVMKKRRHATRPIAFDAMEDRVLLSARGRPDLAEVAPRLAGRLAAARGPDLSAASSQLAGVPTSSTVLMDGRLPVHAWCAPRLTFTVYA